MARRRSSGGDFGALVIAIVGLGALAAVSIYVVALAAVTGTVTLAAWLSKVHREQQRRKIAVRRVEKLDPIADPLPGHTSLIPVDRAVFDDLITTEAEAVKVFSVWAKQHQGAPADPSVFVQNAEVGARFIGRLISVFETSEVRWTERPYSGNAKPSKRSGALSPELRNLSDSEISDRTSHIVDCLDCETLGRKVCPACRGSERVSCPDCSGDGKVYGTARDGSRRLMNCRRCSRTGRVQCTACDGAFITCPGCAGSGKQERVAVARRTRRRDVQVEPDRALASAFSWGQDGVDVADDVVAADAQIHVEITANGTIESERVRAASGEHWFNANWQKMQPASRDEERLVYQVFQFLEVPCVSVTWTLPGSAPHVLVLEGLRLLVPPPLTGSTPFLASANAARRTTLAFAAIPAVVLGCYLIRGPFFARVDVAGVVTLVAAAAALLAYALHRHRNRASSASVLAGAAVPAIVLAALLATTVEPTAADVRTLIAEDKPTDAMRALEAALGISEEEAHSLTRQIQLKRVHLSRTSTEAARLLASLQSGTSERTEAEAHVDGLLLREASEAISVGDTEAATTRLSELNRQSAASDQVRLALNQRQYSDCLAAQKFECAITKASEAQDSDRKNAAVAAARARVDELRRALRETPRSNLHDQLRITNDLVAPLSALSIVDPAARDQLAQAQAEVSDRTSRIQAVEERERAAELKRRQDEERREALRQERLRREASRPQPVRCCDGSRSASCYYGQSLRGCCSGHGGVC